MSFLLFLFILVLIFLGGPLIRIALSLWSARRQFKSFMDAARGNTSNTSQQRRKTRREQSRRKVYSSDDGEYVDFEEVKGAPAPQAESRTTVTVEEQVSDAEWEEIN